MNAQVKRALIADSADQPVIIPRGCRLWIHPVGGDAEIRMTDGAADKFTVLADHVMPLGESAGQTIFIRQTTTGASVELMLT